MDFVNDPPFQHKNVHLVHLHIYTATFEALMYLWSGTIKSMNQFGKRSHNWLVSV